MTHENLEKLNAWCNSTNRQVMVEYDNYSKSELAEFSSMEAATMGNFTDPETQKEYGFKFTIGNKDFYEEAKSNEEDEDYLNDE